MKTTTGQAKRSRTLTDRKKSLNCSNALYHFGLILSIIGVLLTIIAMATNYLFTQTCYKDNKKIFTIPYGLYSTYGYKENENNETVSFEKPVEMDSYYTAAAIMTFIGLVAGIIVVIIHVLFCIKENFRKRKVIFIQITFLLIAIIGVLAGLSFAETQIESMHDGDESIIKFMKDNKLANEDDIKFGAEGESGLYTLNTSTPQYSFYLLVVATILFLLAFVFALIYFVRLCERINKEERELRQNLTKPENVEATTALNENI